MVIMVGSMAACSQTENSRGNSEFYIQKGKQQSKSAILGLAVESENSKHNFSDTLPPNIPHLLG